MVYMMYVAQKSYKETYTVSGNHLNLYTRHIYKV